MQTSPISQKSAHFFGHFRLLQWRPADLNDQALARGRLSTECCELATKLFLSGTPLGLLQRFQPNGIILPKNQTRT